MLRHYRTAAADIRRALDEAYRAVGVDAGHRAGWTAAVEPRAAGDAPSSQLAGFRFAHARVVVGVTSACFQRLDVAYLVEHGPRGLAGTLLRAIDQPDLDRVDAQLLRQLIYGRLRREGCRRGTRSPVSSRLLRVYDHVVALDQSVGNGVGRKHRAASGGHGRPGKRPGLVHQLGLHSRHLAVAGGPDLYLGVCRGGRSRALEYLRAGHGDLYWRGGLFG